MDNKNLTFEKLRLMGQYASLRITPYKEFQDGTKGSVLLLRFNCSDSLLFLFNSPERKEESDYGKSNNLHAAELDLFHTYRQFCTDEHEGFYCTTKEIYERYGVVLLAGEYVTAPLADYFCHNLNTQDEKRRSNWQIDRVRNLFSKARTECWLYKIEDEFVDYLSEDRQWQRSIAMEALKPWKMDEQLDGYLHMDWRRVRERYAKWLGQNYITVKLYFAKQVLAAYHQSEEPINWLRMLEDALRDQREYTMSFRYSDYGVQEIIGLYALSKYLYTEKPVDFAIHYAHVEQVERVAIFKEYQTACTNEMLEELNAEDDPFRTELPTREEAEEKAKQRIASMVGRQPEELTDKQKDDYAKYEQAFCHKHQTGISHEDRPTEQQTDCPPIIGTQNNQNCTINNFFTAPLASPQDSIESLSSPKKRGPKMKLLFVTQEGKEDIARTKEEKERLRMYLNDHKLGSRKLTTEKDNILLKIVVCFYRKWLQNGYVSEYNATAAVRFLTETCEIPHEVDKVSIANRLQQMLKSGEYDRETAGMVSEYF